MIRTASALLVALSASLVACAPGAGDPSTPVAAAAGAGEAPTNRVEIPASVRRNLGITFARVEVRDVAHTLRVPGSFEPQPRARHEYRMTLPGRVQLLVDQFERVEPGTPLYRFRSPDWPELLHEILVEEQAMDSARAEIRVGRARLEETRRKLALARERIQALAQADFKKADLEIEAAELEASLPRLEAEVGLAETRLANAERTRRHALHRASNAAEIPEAELEARVPAPEGGGGSVPRYLTLDWIEVRATEAGLVEELHVTDGAFVESPETVLSTLDPERLRFRAQALQGDLPGIVGAKGARIVPPPSPGLPADAGVEATMTIGLEAHPEERTVTLIAVPTTRAGWMRAGVSAFLELVLEGGGGPALAVPRSAVVQDGLTHVLFRRDPADPNRAIRVEADLGVSDGRWVVLNSGVARGDEVVLSGAYELKLATQRSGVAQQGGHFHADGSYHGDH